MVGVKASDARDERGKGRARGASIETETGHRSTENGDLVREQQAAPDYFWF